MNEAQLRVYRMVVQSSEGEDKIGPLCWMHITEKVHTLLLQEPKNRPSRKRINKISKRQEQRTARDVGGRTQAGSGSRAGYKGDVRNYDHLRVENKFTYARTFKLEHSDLSKIRGECEGHETPALQVDFNDRATGRTLDSWVVIPYALWKEEQDAVTEHS